MTIKGEGGWADALITAKKKRDYVLHLFQRAEATDVVIIPRNSFHCCTRVSF